MKKEEKKLKKNGNINKKDLSEIRGLFFTLS